MRESPKNIAPTIVVMEDQIDLSKAAYSPDLSSTAMDEETQTFHVTMDKIAFKKPVEIITTVLDANGFALNLENILACLDELTIGAKVKLNKKNILGSYPAAKDFLPCIQFQLPSKTKIGPMLQRFYTEIEGYESQISRLQKGSQEKRSTKAKTPEQLQKEIDKLSSDNQKLTAQVDELSSRLAQAAKFQASANKALASQNIMPPNLKIATVRELSMKDRMVLIKSGRTVYQLPMSLLHQLPNPGSHCLVHVQDGEVTGAFFYDSDGKKFQTELAQILFVTKEVCKVRDSRRQVHTIYSKNDAEKEIFEGLARNDKVLLYTIDRCIIRIESIDAVLAHQVLNKIQEQIALFQIQAQEDT